MWGVFLKNKSWKIRFFLVEGKQWLDFICEVDKFSNLSFSLRFAYDFFSFLIKTGVIVIVHDIIEGILLDYFNWLI
jgi:hypothetical protein